MKIYQIIFRIILLTYNNNLKKIRNVVKFRSLQDTGTLHVANIVWGNIKVAVKILYSGLISRVVIFPNFLNQIQSRDLKFADLIS
jgi:hypothetical protein